MTGSFRTADKQIKDVWMFEEEPEIWNIPTSSKREKKEGSVCWMARLQISAKILGYEFIEKEIRERQGIKYPEYKLVRI